MRTHSPHPHSRRPSHPGARRLLLLVIGSLFALGLLTLAGCGANGPVIIRTPPVTVTPGAQQYAYLYSRIDYPLQIPVGSGDTVTLTLSPQDNILTVTPSPGSGSTTAGAPIPLPTDLHLYRDIGAEADTVDTARSPVVWQLQSPPRQSLLTAPGAGPRAYQDSVVFRWHVQAMGIGENSINVMLRLYYIYLDGSEHDGSVQITQAPIPILALQPSPISNSLPTFRLPLAGFTWLAGFIAVLRFFWKAYQTINTVTEPVKDAAAMAGAVKKRIAGSGGGSAQSAARAYPNPWAQPHPWPTAPSHSAPPPDAPHPDAHGRPILPPSPSSLGPAGSWPPGQQPSSGPPPRDPNGW